MELRLDVGAEKVDYWKVKGSKQAAYKKVPVYLNLEQGFLIAVDITGKSITAGGCHHTRTFKPRWCPHPHPDDDDDCLWASFQDWFDSFKKPQS